MDVFDQISAQNHEQMVFCYDEESGLKAIIAVHNTTLGPALGGVRMWPYKTEADAMRDVLRLSRGMTFKSAAAGLNLGGGKAVIIGDAKKVRTEALFRAYGRFVEGLAGRYITAEDVGTDVKCMEWVRMETSYVTGISRALGGSGDPSPVTAIGTFHGLKACAKVRWGSESLSGKRINVQGVGAVGYHLVKHLVEDGAIVTACDIDEGNLSRVVRELEVKTVEPDRIFDVEGEIFAPCALGGVINDDTLARLKVEVVGGSANNVLENEKIHGRALKDKGVLYAPDYVINAGGLINVANELEGYNQERALKQAVGIFDIILKVFEIAEREDVPTNRAADSLALRRISEIGKLRDVYSPTARTARKRTWLYGVS
ncbi:MAG: Glu/Leu/Phe/Val dehydrogenase [Deltaproteobacteria bacterium]|nr:Glu/Leu/Phe/Val dehydrogenase [Deltaproteobacteria bacterium]